VHQDQIITAAPRTLVLAVLLTTSALGRLPLLIVMLRSLRANLALWLSKIALASLCMETSFVVTEALSTATQEQLLTGEPVLAGFAPRAYIGMTANVSSALPTITAPEQRLHIVTSRIRLVDHALI
jgi:hypothetical protein